MILLEIQCQACHKRFKVEMHWSRRYGMPSISVAIDLDNLEYIHYGDPPRHSKNDTVLCAAGDTMNAESMKILEFWSRSDNGGWERLSQYEIEWEE